MDRSCIGLYTHSFNKPPRNVSQKSGFLYEFFESRRGVTAYSSHFNLLSCNFSDICPTFVDVLSFFILSLSCYTKHPLQHVHFCYINFLLVSLLSMFLAYHYHWSHNWFIHFANCPQTNFLIAQCSTYLPHNIPYCVCDF